MYKKLLNRELLCSKDHLYPCLVFSNSMATLQHQSWNSRGAAEQKHRALIKVEQRNDRNPVQHFPGLCITECYFTATGSTLTSWLHHSTWNLCFLKTVPISSSGYLLQAFLRCSEFSQTNFQTAESLCMVPLRGTQHTLSSAAPDSRKTLEASTQERSWKTTGWGYQHRWYHTVWSWDAMKHLWKMELNGAGYKDAEQRGAHFALCRDRSEPQKRKRRKQALPVEPLTALCETGRLTLAW